MAAFQVHMPFKDYILNLVRYLVAAFIIRSSGCTVNDIVDRNIDGSVCEVPLLVDCSPTYDSTARTKKRPLPSGRVTVRSAVIFLLIQYIFGVIFFATFLQGLPSVIH